MKRQDGRALPHATLETLRLMALRRVRAGEPPSAVMHSYGFCRTTIYRWLRAAAKGGERAVHARKGTGRPPVLTPKQTEQVRRWINGKDPRQYGFDFGLWTRQIVRALVRERFGIELGVTAIGRMLVRRADKSGKRGSSRVTWTRPICSRNRLATPSEKSDPDERMTTCEKPRCSVCMASQHCEY